MRPVLVLLVVLAAAIPAHADRGTRVALIDTKRLFAENGIAAWVDARAKLDAEAKNVVEAWDGKTVKPPPPPSGNESIDRSRQALRDMEERRRRKKREDEMLEPIREEVWRALEPFAKARGIDLVLDRSTIAHAIWYAGPALDITDAVIKDYNARTAKPRK